MSIEFLELAAARLGPMVDEVAFVGGASLVLWIDDPGAPPPRTTIDVDVIVVVVVVRTSHRRGYCVHEARRVERRIHG